MGKNSLVYKNTIILYLRIAVVMIVGLYSSRILLQALGEDDFGVYNVVGSMVLLFGAIKGLFISTTQRYLNYEMGKSDHLGLQKVFNVSINLHWVLCIIFLVIVEPAGIWFINYKMTYPTDLTWVVNALFQMSIISSMATILAAPYDAVLVANQRLDIYAILSIVETVLKLGSAFLILILKKDQLLIYGVLIMGIALIMRSVSRFYCRRYTFCKRIKITDKNLYKEMGKFAGWNFLGNMAFSLSNEGQNLLLNVYFGPAVNAARAIAYQVRNAFYQLTSNLDLAFAPRLTHLFAQGNTKELTELSCTAIRFSVSIVLLVCVPVFFYIDQILLFWLKDVPNYTSEIIKCLMVMIVLKPYATINDTLFRASGDIKKYQIISSLITLMSLISSCIVLLFSESVLSVFWMYNLFCVINVIYTYILLGSKHIIFSKTYIKTTIFRGIVPTIILFALGICLQSIPIFNAWILNALILFAITALYIVAIQTTQQEKRRILAFIHKL